MHDVAIIIVTYNSSGEIEACLRSVFAQRRSVTQQVVVVDNMSTDGTVSIVREKFPEVVVIEPGKNLGFAAGCNLGASQADAEFILLLNPDTEVLEHGIDVVVEFAQAHPGFGMYGGRGFQPDGSLERSSCWGAPSLWSFTTFALGLSSIFRHNAFFDPESLGGWPRDTVRTVGVITGCFLLVSKQNWSRLGGFDERYFMYGEDADLTRRAWDLGMKPVICPDAKFMHEVGKSSATHLAKAMLLYKGKACYVRTHWSGLHQSLGLAMLALGVWIRAMAERIRGFDTRSPDQSPWSGLWRRRDEWKAGYPALAAIAPGQRSEIRSQKSA